MSSGAWWQTRLLSIPLRYPRSVLVVIVAVTVVLGFFAAQIKVDSSIENLLPAEDPERAYYHKVREIFGSEEILVIAVVADDVFAPGTLAKMDRLSERIGEIDGVEEVLSLTTVKGVEVVDGILHIGRLMRELPSTIEEASAFRRRVFSNSIYVKNLVSADSRGAGISVVFEPMSDEEFMRRDIDGQIRRLVAEMEGPEQFALTGIPTLKVSGARLMEQDTETFTPLSLLLVIVVLAVMFRTLRGVVIPLTALLIGVIWTTGVMVLSGSAITMGTLVLNPLLMVVGIAAGIHVVSQYYWELRPGRTQLEVVSAAMEHVRVPVTIAAATTVIGFATLVFTDIRAIREFGVYSVFGIAVILLAAFTVVPAALVLLPLPESTRRHVEEGWLIRLLQRISEYAVENRRPMMSLAALVLAASAWGITRIRVDTNYLSFFHPASEIRRDNDLISRRLAGTQPIYVVLDGERGSMLRLETLIAMRDLQQFIDRQPGVDKTLSLVDYVRLARGALSPDLPPGLPQEQSEIDQMMLFVDPADLRAVVTPELARANIIVRTTLSGSTEVRQFVERVQAFAAGRMPRNVSVRATGSVVLLNRSADVLVHGQVSGLWQELTALLILLSSLFLSLRVGFLALIPNVVPTVILFGIMGWAGISLNISTSMIAAIAIGIAIDDTIHLLSSFNAELRRSGDQQRAVVYAIRSAGQAAVFISMALAAGFFIVCLSNFQPIQHFGLLSGTTMAVAVVTELFFTPALLTTTKIVTLWDLVFLKLGREPHRQIPLFTGLRPFQTKIVVLMAHLAAATRGVFITRRGEMRSELYVLLNGRAEARRSDSGAVLKSFTRGDVIGEMGLVRGRPRSADVIAVEDSEYLVLDHHFLQRMRRQYPRIAATVFLNLTRILSDRLENTTDQLVLLQQADARDRPAGEEARTAG